MLRYKTLVLGTLFAANTFAALPTVAPKQLITHNLTNVWSEAYVNDLIRQEKHASRPNETNYVPWAEVTLACHGRPCWAVVKMNTKGAMVDLCRVDLDLRTGIITPEAKCAGNNGYALTVNGPGEVTLSTK